MLQLLLGAVTIFCKIGGPYAMPFIAAISAPVAWSVLCLCFILPIYCCMDPNTLNSTDTPDGKKEYSFKRSISCGFLIYYPISVIVLCIVAQSLCKARDELPI